jgi:hypothetical protein
MQTILSDSDIHFIMNAEVDAASDLEEVAEELYMTLIGVANAVNLRKRFYDAVYHKRSTLFQIYQTPVLHTKTDHAVSVVLAMINYDVLRRFSEACGKGVHASYNVEKFNLNIYLEFTPPEVVNIETADDVLERRLEKETSW